MVRVERVLRLDCCAGLKWWETAKVGWKRRQRVGRFTPRARVPPGRLVAFSVVLLFIVPADTRQEQIAYQYGCARKQVLSAKLHRRLGRLAKALTTGPT